MLRIIKFDTKGITKECPRLFEHKDYLYIGDCRVCPHYQGEYDFWESMARTVYCSHLSELEIAEAGNRTENTTTLSGLGEKRR